MSEFSNSLRAAAGSCPAAARELREQTNEVAGHLQFCEGLLASAAMCLDAMEVEMEQMRRGLEKLLSYNEDIAAGRINYRPQDHIAVARDALGDDCLSKDAAG